MYNTRQQCVDHLFRVTPLERCRSLAPACFIPVMFAFMYELCVLYKATTSRTRGFQIVIGWTVRASDKSGFSFHDRLGTATKRM
jgi:hypothetical protein